MATYGYTAPYYFKWEIFDDGNRKIFNGAENQVFYKYDDGWDHPRRYQYPDGTWAYVYTAEGAFPTASGASATLSGDAGNDEIHNAGNSVLINGGAGNDDIYNSGSKVSINGGEGDDYIDNSGGNNVIINAGNGDDTITNRGCNNVLINTGAGNDSIENFIGSNVTISTGDGDDTILSDGRNTFSSIDAGTGDDSIIIGEAYANGSGSDITVEGSIGKDTISNYVGKTSINGGDGDDIIYNNVGELVTIRGGAGNDSIFNGRNEEGYWSAGNNIFIDSGDGNNYISNFNGANVTILAGMGNDTFSNGVVEAEGYYDGGNSISVNAGDGNNVIYNCGNDVTIKSGTGDDSIINLNKNENPYANDNSGENVLFQYEGGNDIITGFYETSTLQIGDGTGTYSTQESGADLLINVGDSTVTLKDVYTNYYQININEDVITFRAITLTDNDNNVSNILNDMTIKGTSGNDEINNYGNNVIIEGDAGDDVIYNSGNNVSIDGGAGDDVIYNSGNNVSIDGGAGNDYINNNDDGDNNIINAGAGNDTVSNSGRNLKLDTGAGNDSVYNSGANVSISMGGGNDYIYNQGASALFKYTAGDGNDIIEGFNETSTLSIANAKYYTVKSDDDIVIRIGDSSITLSGAATLSTLNIDGEEEDLINLTFNDKISSAVTLDSVAENVDASSRKKAIKITGNDLNNFIVGGTKNDTLEGAAGDDTLTGGKGNDLFIYDSGDDLITDYAEQDKISVASAYQDFEINDTNLIFGFGDNDSLTIKDGKGKAININSIASYYTAEGILNAKQKLMTLRENIEGNFSAAKYSKLVTIDGSKVDNELSITGNKKANYIIAGGNGATLNGGKGNDTLKGGDSADVFIYSKGDGKDVIENFAEDDIISLGGSVIIKDAYMKSKNAVIKVGSGSITVKNISANEVTFGQGDNETLFSNGVFIHEDSAKVLSSFKGTINLYDYGVTTADASLAKKAVTIIGGASDDSLIGGKSNDKLYGKDGNNSISGGAGNDSLWGGDGEDTFLYSKGDGNDIITGFDNDDLLKISSKFTASYNVNKNEIAFKVGSGSITLKDFKATEFHINNEIWQLSSGSFSKK